MSITQTPLWELPMSETWVGSYLLVGYLQLASKYESVNTNDVGERQAYNGVLDISAKLRVYQSRNACAGDKRS